MRRFMDRRFFYVAVAVLWIAALLAVESCAHAQTAGEKEACRPDALRLCSAGQMARALFGDRTGIIECFIKSRRELSLPCDRVLRSHGL